MVHYLPGTHAVRRPGRKGWLQESENVHLFVVPDLFADNCSAMSSGATSLERRRREKEEYQ